MKIKPAVWSPLAGIRLELRPALIVCERVMKAHGVDLVITSGLDGEHSAGSYHYYGLAFDVRTKHLSSQAEIDQVAAEIRAALDPPFELRVEPDHIHVEYDWESAKRGGHV